MIKEEQEEFEISWKEFLSTGDGEPKSKQTFKAGYFMASDLKKDRFEKELSRHLDLYKSEMDRVMGLLKDSENDIELLEDIIARVFERKKRLGG